MIGKYVLSVVTYYFLPMVMSSPSPATNWLMEPSWQLDSSFLVTSSSTLPVLLLQIKRFPQSVEETTLPVVPRSATDSMLAAVVKSKRPFEEPRRRRKGPPRLQNVIRPGPKSRHSMKHSCKQESIASYVTYLWMVTTSSPWHHEISDKI
jgi:hypothetical protein